MSSFKGHLTSDQRCRGAAEFQLTRPLILSVVYTMVHYTKSLGYEQGYLVDIDCLSHGKTGPT